MSKHYRICLYFIVSVLIIGAGNILCSPNVRADANSQTVQATETNSAKQNLHSNDSIANPVNWNNWQKNPTLNPVLSANIDNHNLPEATDVISLDTGWETKGDTVATATLNKTLNWMVSGENGQDESYANLESVLINNKDVPLSETKTDKFVHPLENGYVTAFSIPLNKYISTDSISTNGNAEIKGKVTITHTNPRYAMTYYQLNSDLLTIENPQVVRVFYKDSETGKDIYPSTTLGENGIIQQSLPDITAPKISGYSLRSSKSTEYQSASVSKEAFFKLIQELPGYGGLFTNPGFLNILSKEYNESFGGNPLSLWTNYVDQNYIRQTIATKGIPTLPYGLVLVISALGSEKKSTNLFDYLQTNVTKFSDSDTIQGLKLSTNPQAVFFGITRILLHLQLRLLQQCRIHQVHR
ncbi:hypothetical protein G8J22_00580 [Lentilactobacillus hilgardii]|uniref:hypothetical protein n=1 Tax=Lentilactobacillus hilgardii TaxID=1588 RepID=UPI00019C4770|nr:hypothetical protein [Lentilactobacillus hilgardii]EEI20306.1 hypothetical protein HMPREF0497_0875 [Lentilactobacillus buchneri ATCC 11577]QIR08646.1 hypothetical protein G8J22_00580 [Lentilactobacillus hilgardii]